jgi:hypothetical protein
MQCTTTRVNADSRTRIAVRSAAAASMAALTTLSAANPVFAAAEFKIGDNSGVTAGFGLRTSYTRLEKAAPNGTSYSNDFAVESVRLYLGGHYNNMIKGTFNTERTGGPGSDRNDIRVLDAIAQFEFHPAFNVWLGRFLPPSDRPNLYGPYFVLPWSYPGVASNYPAIFAGRDDGVMVWGKPFGGKVSYSIGAFEGHNKNAALSGASDKPLYAARLHFNLLDVEPPPAHYLGGTYYGAKDILSVGLAGFYQSDGVGTVATPGKLKIWSADLLFEKKFAFGVPTLEGAYYKYNLGAVDCNSGEPGSVACTGGGGDNLGGQVDGKAWLAGLGWLIPAVVGWGQFQPFVRYQKFERSVSDTSLKAFDVGLNYIIKGSNAKLSAMFTKFEDSRLTSPLQDRKQFLIGAQLQY